MKSLTKIFGSFLLPASLLFSQEKLSKELVADLNGDGFPEKSLVCKINGKPELRIIDGKDSLSVKKYSGFPRFSGLYLAARKNINHLVYLVDKSGGSATGFEIFYDFANKYYYVNYSDFKKESNPELF
jgi:hypothetical protein